MSSQISPDCVGLALVDDDAMALAHLESYFSDVEDFTILTATRSPRAVLRFVQSHQVDVLITDVHMEHMDGVEMTREVLRLSPSTRVILLTTVDTDEDLLQGLGAGASGFLLKSAPAEEIIAAVRTVHSGAKVVAPPPATQILGINLVIGFALCLAYILATSLTSQIANVGLMAPWIAAWIPNVAFIIAALLLWRKAPQ